MNVSPPKLTLRITDLSNRIAELERQLTEAKFTLAGLREAQSYILGTALEGEMTAHVGKKKRGRPAIKLHPDSTSARAYRVLEISGAPMHINDLVVGMGMENNPINRRDVASAIRAHAKRDRHFIQVDANTFTVKKDHLTGKDILEHSRNGHSSNPLLLEETPDE